MASSNQVKKDEVDKAALRREAVSTALRSPHFYHLYIIGLLFLYCSLVYYFGELVDYAGWGALHWDFFYGVHDTQRLFFLAPIIYAAYVFGFKATMIMTVLSLAVFLPRGIFISPYSYPILRPVLFTIAAGIMGYFTAMSRRESKRRSRLEVLLRSERHDVENIGKDG